MKYFIIFSLYIALNFGQTWNTTTSDYSESTFRNNFGIHKIGNDLIHFELYPGNRHYKLIGTKFTASDYNVFYKAGCLRYNDGVFGGSMYNTELKDGKIWLWHFSDIFIYMFTRRTMAIGVYDTNYNLIDEITNNDLDIYSWDAFTDNHIIAGDSIIIPGLKSNQDSYMQVAKLTNTTLTKSGYLFKSNIDDGTYYESFPIYSFFENIGTKYAISGKRYQMKASPYTETIEDSLTLWENTGSLSEWQKVKTWDKVQYAQFVSNIQGRTYFYLDSDSTNSANRGIWKFYRGVTKKISIPFSDTLTVTGMYSYNDNLFVAVSNGINTNEDYIYRYYMGKWHTERYKLPFACTQMLYDGSRFWVKYVITRQKTYVNTSGGNYLPRYTTDIPIFNDKANYFIGIK